MVLLCIVAYIIFFKGGRGKVPLPNRKNRPTNFFYLKKWGKVVHFPPPPWILGLKKKLPQLSPRPYSKLVFKRGGGTNYWPMINYNLSFVLYDVIFIGHYTIFHFDLTTYFEGGKQLKRCIFTCGSDFSHTIIYIGQGCFNSRS